MMANEVIKVNLIPGEEPAPIFHFSQYDNGRTFIAEMYNGEDPFDCDGYNVTLECRKRDNNLVIMTADTINDNVITFHSTEQLCACYGDNDAEIVIRDNNDIVIGSGNIIINVEKSPTCGGIQSETVIENITEQIAQIVPEVIGDDYYNKTQTDALLEDKADVSDLPDMSNYYNKAQTDALLFNMLPIGTASGNPCNFETAIADKLVSLLANIVASGGGGTPATPIPIVGHSELNFDVNGDTFTVSFGQTVYGGVLDANRGKVRITHKYKRGGFSRISIDSSNKLWLCSDLTDSKIYESTEAPNAISNMFVGKSLQNCRADNSGFCIFPRGLYIAGYVGNESALDALLPNLEIAYELATPIEIDVSELSVSTIVGTNNIVSDCGGDVNVSYKDSIQHYIDSRI